MSWNTHYFIKSTPAAGCGTCPRTNNERSPWLTFRRRSSRAGNNSASPTSGSWACGQPGRARAIWRCTNPTAQRLRRCVARLDRGRRGRLALLHRRLRRAAGARRGRGPETISRPTESGRAKIDSGFRAESSRRGPCLGDRPAGFVCPKQNRSGRDISGEDGDGRTPDRQRQGPVFPPWTDVAQLDYRRAATRAAMQKLLLSIATRCDGVRCDMAMLLLNDVFAKTWAHLPSAEPPPAGEFWSDVIPAVKRAQPGFSFLAEVYWGLEGRLQSLGFDSPTTRRSTTI